MRSTAIGRVRILFLLVLFMSFSHIYARKLPGYIVTENNDTIEGRVKVKSINSKGTGFLLHQLNLEECYREVCFCKNGESVFMPYKPEMVRSFAFQYKGQDYLFYRFLIKRNETSSKEDERYEFLNLVQDTKAYSIYRSLQYIKDYRGEDEGDIFTASPLVPTYLYYKHLNGSAPIINEKNFIQKKEGSSLQ